MLERDYIMKQINQLVAVLNRVIAAILKLKKNEEPELSIEQINTLLRDTFSFDIRDILTLESDSLIQTLKEQYNLNEELIGQLGDILFELAELDLPEYPSHLTYQKSLAIYEQLEQEAEVFSFDRHLRIQLITDASLHKP